jgi:hypothetical protein
LQLLPGVQSGPEGSTGLYVRGGGPDQNLILLDGVPVYNASHLFGFYSVFNSDAINHIELTKGGFPARFGGRLSSVVDISMKEGNDQKIKGEGSMGIISSRLTLEGPIKKGKTSFLVSGRRTYADLLIRPFLPYNDLFQYYFYDTNIKINHRFNANNRIYLSVYAGKDKMHTKFKGEYNYPRNNGMEYEDDFGLNWGNVTTALRWNHTFSSKIFGNVTSTFSRYNFNTYNERTEHHPAATFFSASEYTSGVRDWALKADLDYIPNPSHYFKFGGQVIDHMFTPGISRFQPSAAARVSTSGSGIAAREFYGYVEDDILITPDLKLNLGVHASGFWVEGRYYSSIQPRVAAKYALSDKMAGKISYAEMTQYIHLLANGSSSLPTDLWVPVTSSIGPQRSKIIAAGLAYKIDDANEFTLESYYKKMTGLIDHKEGAVYLGADKEWQAKVEKDGVGESYGTEVFFHKKKGDFNGWFGYTLSWTNRKFSGINNGKTFPYKYDQRHHVTMALSYRISEKRDISMSWVYGTGAALTLPSSRYREHTDYGNAAGMGVVTYGDHNGYRMRDYHRLDLSYSWHKKKRWGERSWIVGVYNAFRKNPFFVGVINNGFKKQIFEYSLLPIIPSVSYHFKF